MKNIIKFLLFIIYSTLIFLVENNLLILIFVCINLLLMLGLRKKFIKIIKSTFKILPFIILTFIINILLDNFYDALCISLKLLIVCNITFIYSNTTKIIDIANTIALLCRPLKKFINEDEIKIIVCISLSMIPILKKDLLEVKEACIAKNIKFNLKNMKYILYKFFISLLKQVNETEEALISKGYNY